MFYSLDWFCIIKFFIFIYLSLHIFFRIQTYLSKVEKRVKTYNITEINPPREGKKLLVLDIDYTLFDHRSSAESGESSDIALQEHHK